MKTYEEKTMIDYEEEEMMMSFEEEMMSEKENAIAIAENENVIIFLAKDFDCGWALNSKIEGTWSYDEITKLERALKEFKEAAIANGIKKVLIDPYYLDLENVKAIDKNRAKAEKETEYYDACTLSEHGDESLMERYMERYEEEEDYGPSNPWDAPGMKISDFIKGVY